MIQQPKGQGLGNMALLGQQGHFGPEFKDTKCTKYTEYVKLFFKSSLLYAILKKQSIFLKSELLNAI